MTRIVAPTLLLLLGTALPGCAADGHDTPESGEFRDVCGPGTTVPNPDYDTNPRHKAVLTCDSAQGEVLVGILNQDYGWDSLDGVGALCRLPDGTTREVFHAGDFSNATPDPEPVWCPPGETVTGLAYADAAHWPGVPAGTTDAATVICSDDSAPLDTADLAGNPNPLQIFECPAGEEPIGFAYVDHDGPSYSDLTDAIALVCAPSCSTCDPTPFAQPNPDLDSNHRTPLELLCDEHETMVGIMYREYTAWDTVDSVAIRCENGLGHSRLVMHKGDMSSTPGPDIEVTCPSGRTVTSVAYKDSTYPGIPAGNTDGVTVGCDGGGPMSTDDLSGNPNPYQTFACPAGTIAAGLTQVGHDGPSFSDLNDAVSIVCREVCPAS